MKDKLIYLLGKYGNDFFHKLPMYKTAWLPTSESYVKLVQFYPKSLSFRVEFSGVEPFSPEREIGVFELDNFCL